MRCAARRVWLGLALLAAGGCKPKAPAEDPLTRLPGSCTAVVSGPALGEAALTLGRLVQRMEREGQGPAPMPNLSKEIAARVGFDALSLEGLKAAGWDPAGAFALGWEGGTASLVVLPAGDPALALATLGRLAAQAQQADRVHDEMVGTTKVRTFARPFGSREVVAMAAAVVGSHVVIATGKDAPARLATVLALRPEVSMARNPIVMSAGARASTAPLRLLLDSGVAAKVDSDGKIAARTVENVLGGLRAEGNTLELDAHVLLRAEKRAAVLRSLFPPGAPLSALAVADPDAVLLGRGRFLMEAARDLANSLEPGGVDRLHQQAARAGMDVDESILSLSDGQYAGALYLAAPEELAALLSGRGNPRKELLRIVPFVALMRARTAEGAGALVNEVVQRLKARGVAVVADKEDPAVLLATLPGAPSWRSWRVAAVGDQVLVGGGDPAHFTAALQRLRGGTPAPWPADVVNAFADPQTSALVLRLDAAVQRLDQVLAANLGQDADALMARSFLQKVRASLVRMQDVTLEMKPDGDGVRGRVRLRWAPEKP